MRRFRPIRQQGLRARRGQVAAVATILALLLLVTVIANFALDPLSAEMSNVELVHVLTVEDQIARLQATILAEVAHGPSPIPLTAPVTLGSGAVEPFGQASNGAISPEASNEHAWTQETVGTVVSAPPLWNNGSSCLTGGSGHCSGNGNIDTWNITGQNFTTFTLTVTGNHNSARYNISANNDTINLDWTGGDTGFVQFIINGSNDVVNYNKGGSDTNFPTAQFLFYGQNDQFNFNPSGSHSSKGGMFITVAFIGSQGIDNCPDQNLSASDSVGTLSSGGSNLAMNVIWWNLDGYTSAPHVQTYPGGAGNNETVTWSNETGILGCAFTRDFSTNLPTYFSGGVVAHLFNRYIPPTDVAMDQGAVIVSQQGGVPIMAEPPPFSFKDVASKTSAHLTLINMLGNFTEETGLETAGVLIHVTTVQTFQASTGVTKDTLLSPLALNITSPYPQAWMTYFAGLSLYFPLGTTCTPGGVFVAPYSCASPPPGAVSTITADLLVQQLTITVATVSLSLA